MDFSVNTRAVIGLSDALDRRSTDLLRADSYLRANSSLEFGPGLVNVLLGTHEHIMATVERFLRLIAGDYAGEYSHLVGQAVRAYATTDLSASARLDATMPGAVDTSAHLADQSLGPEVFADRTELLLSTPPSFDAEFPYEPEWADLISPSSVPRDTIWQVTSWLARLGIIPHPVDPYEVFTKPLCGDWAGLARVSYALTGVAQALSYVAERLGDEAGTVDRVWTGHAAGNCRTAMRGLAGGLQEACDIVVRIAADYHDVAVTAYKHGEALGTLVSLLIDACGSLGTEIGVEVLVDSLTDGVKLERAAEAIWAAVTEGKALLEALVAYLHTRQSHLDDLCRELGVLTEVSMAVHLPQAAPAVPQPAQVHR